MRLSKSFKIIIPICIAVALIVSFAAWVAWGNNHVELNSYKITSERLPKAFNGFKIAHISDLHNAEFGEDNETLIAMLKDANPNVVFITGDMIDSRNLNLEIALSFAEKAVEIAPCYYVSGNHEARIKEYKNFKEKLIELGVVVLENSKQKLEVSGETITIIGIKDPSFSITYETTEKEVMQTKLGKLTEENDGYTVLLSHRPELFEIYLENGVDLVFSGHAHGGQIRLPFIGGLIAPSQGFFPKYDAGIYSENNTNMVVSRGIGASVFPFRINNNPEIVLVELTAE